MKLDPAALEAEAHALLARGHELLAAAARARGGRPVDPRELVSVRDAARLAATSLRVVRAAIHTGDLPAFGGQRDRAVRREDLNGWIESRRLTLPGPNDDDVERRMKRLARTAKKPAP